jgi:hypothetical protein
MAEACHMNDNDREQWINNDVDLFKHWRKSRRPLGRWVRANRAILDLYITRRLKGERPELLSLCPQFLGKACPDECRYLEPGGACIHERIPPPA